MPSRGDATGGTADAADIACKAIPLDGSPPDNILFVPPCDCPRCAPDRFYDRSDDGPEWLRLPGRAQRYRVELVRLGTTGRAVLG